MKRTLTVLLTAVLMVTFMALPMGVSAAITSPSYANFAGYENKTPAEPDTPIYNNSAPTAPGNSGITFANAAATFGRFSAASGIFGKGSDDVSLKIGTEEGVSLADGSTQLNPYLNAAVTSSLVPEENGKQNVFQVRAKMASGDAYVNKYIELHYFYNAAGSHSTGPNPKLVEITKDGVVLFYNVSTGITLRDFKSRWYDFNIVITAGFEQGSGTGKTYNKTELYMDGTLIGTRFFNMVKDSEKVTGIRAVRIGYNASGAKYEGTLYHETAMYIDDYSLTVYTNGDKPYIPPQLISNDPTGVISVGGSFILVDDPATTIGEVRDVIAAKTGVVIEYMTPSFDAITENNAPAIGNTVKVTDTDGNWYYIDIEETSDIVILNFDDKKLGDMGTTRKVGLTALNPAGHEDKGDTTVYFAEGLGGRDIGDFSHVIDTKNYDGYTPPTTPTAQDPKPPSGTSFGPDSFINYMHGTDIQGVVSFECSIYKDAPDASVSVQIPYRSVFGGAFVFDTPLKLEAPQTDTNGEIIKDENGEPIRLMTVNDSAVVVGRYEEKQWYKASITYNTATKKARVYVNGDPIVVGTDGSGNPVYEYAVANLNYALRLKAEIRFPEEATANISDTSPRYNGIAAFDDFKFFFGPYDNTYNYIGLESKEPNNIFINTALGQIDIDKSSMGGTLTVDEFLSKFDYECGAYRVYTDNTLTELADGGVQIETGMVMVLESQNGETYKYYKLNATPVGILSATSGIEFDQLTSTVTINCGTTVKELTDGLTTYPDNDVAVKTLEDLDMGENDVILENCKIVVSTEESSSTKTYAVVVKGLIIEGPVFMIDDAPEPAETLTAGEVKAEFNIVSCEAVARDAVVMIAVYEGNRLAGIKIGGRGTTGERTTDAPLSASIRVDDPQGKSVRAFMWTDGVLEPITKSDSGISAQ